MATNQLPKAFRQYEIPGRISLASGQGDLPRLAVTTPGSSAEIYLHGAHVTAFGKNGEPPLLFLSRCSRFAAGQPIRGGIPICFPWFGPRTGEPAHGFARLEAWDWVESSAAPDGTVRVRLRLPHNSLKPEWSALRPELVVTVADALTLEFITTNESADQSYTLENCLHTYFAVGEIGAVSLTGLQGAPFDDFAAGAAGARKAQAEAGLRLTRETNRVYPDATGPVEIRDEHLGRTIRVEKFNSRSTVVWNPWTTQQLPDDFDPAEYRRMVCVESGNVKQNRLTLPPGGATSLKVRLSTQPL